jgi:putative hydrolase of the HAD superfamily
VGEWARHENFFLFDDALPTLDALRAHGLALGLISNGQRDLAEFAQHHRLDVDVCVGSLDHGRVKPHPSIFEAALAALGVGPEETAMVGDSPTDDIAGAAALGIRTILLDREGRFPAAPDRIDTLLALPAALGLAIRSA